MVGKLDGAGGVVKTSTAPDLAPLGTLPRGTPTTAKTSDSATLLPKKSPARPSEATNFDLSKKSGLSRGPYASKMWAVPVFSILLSPLVAPTPIAFCRTANAMPKLSSEVVSLARSVCRREYGRSFEWTETVPAPPSFHGADATK